MSSLVYVGHRMIVTKQYLNKHKTGKGGWTKKQLVALGVEWPPTKGWKKIVIGHALTDEKVRAFEGVTKSNDQIINKVSKDDKKDWSWKPENKDIPAIKVKSSKKNKNRGKKKANRKRVSKFDNDQFYTSRDWRELRVRVLEKYGCKCMMCGESPKDHSIVIHIDHIKPRSKYPELSLEFSNLQLLCENCNLGKSNKFSTDWRPALDEKEKIDAALDMEQLAALNTGLNLNVYN